MPSIKKSVQIDAQVERVFAYLSDVSNLPEIWPSMIEIKNIEVQNGLKNFDWIYKMAGMRFAGHSEMLEFVPNERVVTRSTKGIPSNIIYTYEDLGNKTKVGIEVEYEIPGKLLSRIAEPIIRRVNEREASTLLENLKDRMEHAEFPQAPFDSKPKIDRQPLH